MAYVEKSGDSSWRVRYQREDGSLGSLSGFATEEHAEDEARKLNRERGKGRAVDPKAGEMPLGDWIDLWFGSIDVARTTLAQYRSLTRNHIQPRWGTTPLDAIGNMAVHTWVMELRARGLARTTAKTILKLLTMMLADAADETLIPTNPIRPRRRGRRRHERTPERIWATPEQAVRVALQAARLNGGGAGILIITAAWTGARWGELTGLQRFNTHLNKGYIVIDPDIGALHEVDGTLELGPPKTEKSARTITLPPFLIELLRIHLDSHDHPHVFTSSDQQLLRRSNFSRRAMRPAADGNHQRINPTVRVDPVKPGLTFHGFRHSHKTWMIADGIPDVAQARRLGHDLPDKIADIYSHVADEVEARLIAALQRRWDEAFDTVTAAASIDQDSPAARLGLPAA